MKNKRLNIAFIIILLAVLVGAGVFAAVKLLNQPTDAVVEQEESNRVQLLTFDSYEELTGTKIRLENAFGKISMNKDKTYITEGDGSIAIYPQGDYTRETWNPYMQLDCMNTTFGSSDFSELKSITMDVYNDSDEEREIAISFTIANYSENFLSTPTVMFTLEPNSWTECTYNVAEEIVASYFNLTNVRYMTIVFPDHKESKDDVIEAIYFDNLYGTKYDVAPEVVQSDYDFYEGVGFEDIAEQYLISGETADTNKMSFERITYADAGIEQMEGFGEWLMKADVTGRTWPSFWLHYGEVIPKDTILSFWVYVEVDAEENDTFLITSHTNAQGYDRAENTVSAQYAFNQWIPVKILLNDASDVSYTFFNFDDFETVEGVTRFGDKPVTIYMDNFKLETSAASVSVDEQGNVALRNPLGAQTISYDVDMPFKKGETIAFDIDFNISSEVSIWVLADGKWNDGTEINEFHAMNYPTWDGKRTIMAEVKKDISNFTIVVKYFDTNNLETNICTISNIRKAASRAEVQANDDVVIKNPSGDARYVYDYAIPVKKGQRIAFDIDFNTTEAVAVWLLAEGKWNSETDKTNEWYAYGYEEWTGKQTIVVEATRDISYFSIGHEYRGSEDYTKNVCTISNVRILDPDAVVNKDGSVTLSNQLGGDTVFYDVMLPVNDDEVVRFDLDFNSTEPVTVWVMAEGQWNTDTVQNEFYAYAFEQWDGRRQITAKASVDADWFRIFVKYGGETDPAKKVCTISNIGIEQYVPSVVVDGEGNVTLNNKFDTAQNVNYTINTPAKADGKLKFDIDFNTDEALAIWVLGEGSWEKEWYAYGYDAWTGKQTIIVNIPEDANSLQIIAQYRGDESNWASNVCTITNIQVLEPDVTVAPDGTVTLRNSAGSKEVSYDINQALIKGSKLTFDIDFNVEEALAIWVLADGKWNSGADVNELFVNGYDSWDGSKTITVDVTKAVSMLQIYVQYRGEEPHTQKVCTISNIMWSEPDIIENSDGTVIIRNSDGAKDVFYEVTGDIKAGSTFSFDIAVNTTEEIGLWVLGDGSWDNEWFAQGAPIDGTQHVSLEVKKDVSSLMLQIQYRGAEPHTEKVVTLSNIKIEEPQEYKFSLTGVTAVQRTSDWMFYFDTSQSFTGSTAWLGNYNNVKLSDGSTETSGKWVDFYALSDGKLGVTFPVSQGLPLEADGYIVTFPAGMTVTYNSITYELDQDMSYRYDGTTWSEYHPFSISGITANKRANDWMFFLETSQAFTGTTTWLGNYSKLKIHDGTSINNNGWCDFYAMEDGTLGVVITPGQGLPLEAAGYSVTFPAGMTVSLNGVTYTLSGDIAYECDGTTWTEKEEVPSFTITGGTVNKRTGDWMFFLETSRTFTGSTAWLGNYNKLKIHDGTSTNNNGWCDFYAMEDGKLGVVIAPSQGLPATADGYTVTFPAGMTITYNSVTYTLKTDAVFKCSGTTWTKQ